MSESDRDEFLRHNLVAEEKVDGANLGISFDEKGDVLAQNRGSYLHFPGTGQWKKLEKWLTPRIDVLFDNLGSRHILFGEWCYAQHSVVYERLPDWFLGFDIYDKQCARFLSTPRRDILLRKMNIVRVPTIAKQRFTLSELKEILMQPSKLSDHLLEGVYLRFDQDDDWLECRAKLVRPAFIQSIREHWAHSAIKPNQLCVEAQR